MPAYWLADVIGRRIVEHVDPQIVDGVGSYARIRSYGVGDEITCLDSRLPVATLLPSMAEA